MLSHSVSAVKGLAQAAFRPLSPDARCTRLEDAEVTRVETAAYIFRHFWPAHTRRVRLATLGSFALIGASKFAQGRAPLYSAQLLDLLADPQLLKAGDSADWAAAMRAAAAFAAARVAASACREARGAVYAHVVNAANRAMAEELFAALQEAELDFLLRHRPGELSAQVLNASKALGAFLSNINARAIPLYFDVTQLTRRLRAMQNRAGTASSATAVRIAQATLASYFAFSLIYGEARVRERGRLTAADVAVRGAMLESLQNAESVRACDTGQLETARFAERYGRFESRQVQVQTSLAFMNAMQTLIMRSGVLAASAVVADQVFKGQSSVGLLSATQQLFEGISHPLNFVGTMWRECKSNFAEVQNGLRILKLRRTQDAPGASDLRIRSGSVQLRNLSFRYPQAPADALKNINLSIAGRSTVAVVGPSGSGKSTLLRLLLRFYAPQQGVVGVCGQDLSGVTLKSLRKALALVSQETLLFNASLRDNLLYGAGAEAAARLPEVLERCGLEELAGRLGLDGLVGERGAALSGGERQRVALARAMLRESAIVLLDEPTAGLDAENERRVMRAVAQLRGRATVLLVAHKLATVIDADEIVYLHEGMIKERGTHAQLLARNGLYAELWRAQQLAPPDANECAGAARSADGGSGGGSGGGGGGCCLG